MQTRSAEVSGVSLGGYSARSETDPRARSCERKLRPLAIPSVPPYAFLVFHTPLSICLYPALTLASNKPPSSRLQKLRPVGFFFPDESVCLEGFRGPSQFIFLLLHPVGVVSLGVVHIPPEDSSRMLTRQIKRKENTRVN